MVNISSSSYSLLLVISLGQAVLDLNNLMLYECKNHANSPNCNFTDERTDLEVIRGELGWHNKGIHDRKLNSYKE